MRAMPVGCYKQMSAIKEGVIMRLQCIHYITLHYKRLHHCELRVLAVLDTYPRFIEPTITQVPSGFSRYIWLNTKIKKMKIRYLPFRSFLSRAQLRY